MKKIGILLLIGMFFVQGASAQTVRNLTLADIVEMVMTESQDLRKANANVRRMKAIMDSVQANRRPALDINARYANIVNLDHWNPMGGFVIPQVMIAGEEIIAMPDHVGTVGAMATQTLYSFGRIGYALNMARSSLRIAETSRKLAEVEIRAAAVQMYWSAKMMDEMVKVAERSLKNTRDAQRELGAAGRANRLNLVKIAADVAAREIDLNDAKFNRDSAFRMLKVYAGIDEDENIRLVSDFPVAFGTVEEQELAMLEWDILNLQANIHDAERRQQKVGFLPNISAFGAYDMTTFGWDFTELGGLYMHNAMVGVTINVPLIDGGARRAQATAAAMEAIAVREDLDRSMRIKTAEYKDLIDRYGHLQRTLKDLFKAKDLAERTYRLSRDRFLAGQTSAVELADVERSLAQMEVAILNATLQILVAAEDIKKYEARS